MNEKLLKFVEGLARTLRYYEHILLDENLKEHHHDAQVGKDIITPIYYEIKNIIRSFDTTAREKDG